MQINHIESDFRPIFAVYRAYPQFVKIDRKARKLGFKYLSNRSKCFFGFDSLNGNSELFFIRPFLRPQSLITQISKLDSLEIFQSLWSFWPERADFLRRHQNHRAIAEQRSDGQ